MDPISRRAALQWGAAGLAGVIVGGVGVWSGASRPWQTPRGTPASSPWGPADLAEPEVLRSQGGVLALDLLAAVSAIQVAGRAATALTYNGTLPGPTWHVRPGDRLRVRLTNQLSQTTNLHTHGLAVSPTGSSDNPFVAVEPGQVFDYDIHLPVDHPTGTFWYHPHHHGMVADQVFGGLYGVIVVEDDSDVALPVTRERVLVVSDITLDGSGALAAVSGAERMAGREGDLVLVNGQLAPTLRAASGGRERWRVVNACVSRYVDLALVGASGPASLHLLGMDSGRYATPHQVTRVLLAPGNRADVVVDVPDGAAEVRALTHDRGSPMMGMMGGGRPSGHDVVLARLVPDGPAAASLDPLPSVAPPRDLTTARLARSRQITLAMGMGMGGMMGFTIDGQEFDPARVDQAVSVGEVEEWTLVNTSPMDHPFHLHVWPMQVMREGSATPPGPEWRDVVNVPAGDSTLVRIPFDRHPGRTVYHCHILDHEDLGMMGLIEAT
jgi:FtsP/CotA-like multicopper oxidase with cupredoxin domain